MDFNVKDFKERFGVGTEPSDDEVADVLNMNITIQADINDGECVIPIIKMPLWTIIECVQYIDKMEKGEFTEEDANSDFKKRFDELVNVGIVEVIH